MSNGNGKNSNGGGAAPNDYQYDVFLSYSYKSTVKAWVTEKFNPRFEDSLDAALIELNSLPPEGGRVCLARRELKPGDSWPAELQEQLRRSKVLVAVFSPHYFISGWCKSEWQTFQNRAYGLAIPALYDGSDAFYKQRLGGIQYADFREFMFIPAARVHLFGQRVIKFAQNVAASVAAAPPFSGEFPSVVLPPVPTPNVQFLSL